MYRTQCVLNLLVLFVGSAITFSWDFVVSKNDQLQFYHNGMLAHSEVIPSAYIPLITFDPVHNRILILNQRMQNSSILSFDIENKKIITLIKDPPEYVNTIVYDPVTDLLFWNNGRSISSYSLKPGFKNKRYGNLLMKMDDVWTRDIAVDSCRGFIYWIAKRTTIIRAKFNGDKREIVVPGNVNLLYGLAIDEQARKMYWIANDFNGLYTMSIESADLNGKNSRTLYTTTTESLYTMLTVSKNFIYCGGWPGIKSLRLLPKNYKEDDGVVISELANSYYSIAAYYRLDENQVCDALRSLLLDKDPIDPQGSNVTLFCVHGTEVKGESRCECAQGYTGARCDVSLCHNYCLQGDCSLTAEGQPKCRCDTGYSGERCEVSICKDYCLQGDCSVSREGQVKCRCNAGYSGDRCDLNPCHQYCLNSGICTVYENDKPVCQCTADYEGDRCEYPAVVIKCIKTVSMLRDMLSADMTPVTLSKEEKTCAASVP